MKHLKSYNESHNFNLKEYFTPIINWKLFRYMQDSVTPLTDKGITMTVFVGYIMDEISTDVTNIYYSNHHMEFGSDREGWNLAESNFIQESLRLNDISHIVYGIEIWDDDHLVEVLKEDIQKVKKLNENIIKIFGLRQNPVELCLFLVPFDKPE